MFEINHKVSKKLLEDYLLSNTINQGKNSILDFVSEGIILTDLSGSIISCNQALLNIWSYKNFEELKKLNLKDLFAPNKIIIESNITDILSNGTIEQEKFLCKKQNGKTFYAELSAQLVKDNEDKPVGYLGIASDISEIESANEQLRLLVTALESAANEVVITEKDGEIIWVNSSFNETTGYLDHEVIGKNPRILKSGAHEDSFYKKLWDTVLSGQIWSGEITNRKKSGEIFTEEMTITPLENSDGEISNFIAIKQDISNRKNVEKKLLDSELKYRSIFENSNLGIYRADGNGDIVFANNRFLQILGLKSIEELKEINVEKDYYLVPATRSKFNEILHKEGKVFGFETKWRKNDGSVVYIRESANAFWNDGKVLEYYEGTVEDITDNVLDKKQIQRQSAILKSLRYISEIFLEDTNYENTLKFAAAEIGGVLNVSNIQIYKKEINEEHDYVYRRLVNWNNTGFENNNFSDVINLSKRGLERWENEFTENKFVTGLVEYLPINEKLFFSAFGVKSIILVPILLDGSIWGEIAFHQCNYNRVWNDTEIEALRAVSETITAAIKRNNYERDLIKAKKQAQAADRTKSEFLAQISHEIRTPLNNITNFNTLIRDELKDNIDDSIQECFDVIDNSSNRLIRTIGLILNLSELHTGSYKLANSNFDIYSDLLEKIYLENKFIAKERKIDFKLINNASRTLVQADSYSLDQIFNNLIDNAFKYTTQGKIEICIENDDKQQIIVKISDTGIGISEEYIPNIFNPFSQEDVGYSRKYDGNGIGLTLVKEYCDLNNINIEVNSKKNEGTTFTLKIKTMV